MRFIKAGSQCARSELRKHSIYCETQTETQKQKVTLTGKNAPSRARSSWCSCCCYAPASSCCSCLGRCCPRLLLASRRDPWSPCLARPPRALGGLLPGAARRACQPCVWLSWGRTQDGVPRPLPPLWASPSACGPPASRPKAAPFNAGTAGTFVVDLDTTNDNNNNNNNNSNNNKEAEQSGGAGKKKSKSKAKRKAGNGDHDERDAKRRAAGRSE